MRFKIFGFKGELATATARQKKKQTKEEKEDAAIVGVGFRTYSEFAPSTSNFRQKHQSNGTGNLRQNDVITAQGNTTKTTKENLDTNQTNKEPTKIKPAKPILKKDSQKESTTPKPILTSPQTQEAVDQNHEKSTLISMTENKVDLSDNTAEPSKNGSAIHDDVQEVKQTSEGKKYITLGGFDDGDDNSDSEDEFGAKTTRTQQDSKRFITLGGFEDSNDYEDSSEDEFGAKKSTKSNEKTVASAQSNNKSKVGIQREENSKESVKNYTDYGYSDQAASIFFRNDSPEPEQRARNFSIKKGGGDSDDDDNVSQTSA